MRRDLSKKRVPLRVAVAKDDANSLLAMIPMWGGRQWFLETGMRSFLDLVESPHSSSIIEWVHQDIRAKRGIAGGPTMDLNLQLETNLFFRFEVLFPESGAMTWFVRRYCHALVEDLRSESLSLEERIEAVINRTMHPEIEDPSEAIHQGPDQ